MIRSIALAAVVALLPAGAFAQTVVFPTLPTFQPITTLRPAPIVPVVQNNTTVFRTVTPALATTTALHPVTSGAQITAFNPPVSASSAWNAPARPIAAYGRSTVTTFSPVVAAPTVTSFSPVVAAPTVTSFSPVVAAPTVTSFSPVVTAPTVTTFSPVVAAPTVTTFSPVVAAPTVTTFSPVVAAPTVTAFSPVAPVAVAPPSGTVRLGTGIIGQPTVYIQGQPIRNALRWLSP